MARVTVTVDVGGAEKRKRPRGRKKSALLTRMANESKRFDHPSMARLKRS